MVIGGFASRADKLPGARLALLLPSGIQKATGYGSAIAWK
jgi:hypothetical protein